MAFEVKVPSVGESIQEGMIHKWSVQDGDVVQVDDVLVELETDKATVEVVAEKSGAVKLQKKEGDTVEVGEVIALIDTSVQADVKPTKDNDSKPVTNHHPTATSQQQDDPSSGKDLSPAVRKIAAENNLQTDSIKGSGRGGRLTKEDAQNAVSNAGKQEAPATNKPTAEAPVETAPTFVAPPPPGTREVRREKMTMIRKAIARNLVASQQSTAMLTTFNEIDMTAVMSLRKKYKETFEKKYGIGLGFMGFFLKASVAALREYPRINAFIDGEEVVYHDYCDVGVAVSSPRGLLVPVIKNVENMSLYQIEASVGDVAVRARNGKIGLDELSGGTFTVSNGGVFGSLMSTPILNAPQSGILGMHKIEKRAVVVDDQVVVRPMMYLALSYDHRMVDGKEAVQFLVKIKEGIEDPQRLLLEI